MILLLLLVFLVGVSMPVQTAVNSRLQNYLGTPLSASFVSFCVGTLLVWLVTLLWLPPTPPDYGAVPLFAWTGGITGMVCVTLFILLFPRLGGVQTVLLPILGQIVTSMLIDTFGWMGMEAKPLSTGRIIGCLIAIAGVSLAVIRKDTEKKSDGGSLLLWQIIGILNGALISIQSAANGTLGALIQSPALASAFSFTVSTILLCFLVLPSSKERAALKRIFTVKRPWWTWTGGAIGVLIVVGFAVSAPRLGVGLMTVVSILGQLVFSAAIDQAGLFGAAKRPLTFQKVSGILLVLAGSLLIYL